MAVTDGATMAVNSANGHSNGTNGVSRSSALTVLVVGGGIGGLTAAIALRREGHNVHVGAVSVLHDSSF